MPTGSGVAAAEHARRYDIDWLRVLAIGLLIPFHAGRVFDIWDPFYVKYPQTSDLLSWFIGGVSPWFMPLLFALAGAATWFALRRRTGGSYLAERTKRLFIPFVFGMLVIVPPQAYLAAIGHGGYSGSFLEFYLPYFQVNSDDLSGYFGGFTPAHLWFILYLFLISVVALPLVLWLRRPGGARVLVAVSGALAPSVAIFVLAVPLALAQALPAPGGQNIFVDLLLFVYGFILVADPRLQASIERNRHIALGAAIITSLSLLPLGAWYDVLRNFNAWFWILALLGYGRILLNRNTALLRYASEAAYPFYILHQTVLVFVAFYVVQWNAGIWPTYLAIVVGSFAATLLIYDLLVRRTNLTRFLFGMKPRPRASTQRLTSQPAAPGAAGIR